MKKLLIALTLVFCVTATEAKSKIYLSGDELYGQCTGDHRLQITTCQSYVLGISDTLEGLKDIGVKVSPISDICIPRSATLIDRILAVKRYLRTKSVDLAYPGGIVVVNALVKAFPCK